MPSSTATTTEPSFRLTSRDAYANGAVAVEISDLGGRREDAVADTTRPRTEAGGAANTARMGACSSSRTWSTSCEEHTNDERHTVRLVMNVDPPTADAADKDGGTS